MEDKATGQNVFSIYLMKKDIGRMKQLLMRGANVNYINKITGLTPLHQAIDAHLNSKIVNFLVKAGANPHMEDYEGKDCCDKATNVERYEKLRALTSYECKKNPSLRIPAGTEVEIVNNL